MSPWMRMPLQRAMVQRCKAGHVRGAAPGPSAHGSTCAYARCTLDICRVGHRKRISSRKQRFYSGAVTLSAQAFVHAGLAWMHGRGRDFPQRTWLLAEAPRDLWQDTANKRPGHPAAAYARALPHPRARQSNAKRTRYSQLQQGRVYQELTAELTSAPTASSGSQEQVS
jgi:hypothetical protein